MNLTNFEALSTLLLPNWSSSPPLSAPSPTLSQPPPVPVQFTGRFRPPSPKWPSPLWLLLPGLAFPPRSIVCGLNWKNNQDPLFLMELT
uniref:Uncharacterized protein LOC105649017 isoform X1 n=1 Tax=Rhizophora mucronata TaxID=61149 RepID=A0A2P2Q2Z4_RHIMU